MPYRYSSGPDIGDILGIILPILGGIVVFIVLVTIFRKVLSSAKRKGISSNTAVDQGFMGMRGRTSEQKKIIKYFNSTGILGMIFRISDFTFDSILNGKAQDYGVQIGSRALEAHGMDADEVKEIPPILVENYFSGSHYFKMFRDLTFRASEYQMSYLMFSEKQMYAYSFTFDLTSANTTEQTREYFYEDITNVDVTQKKIEFPNPRPMGYLAGGIAAIIVGLILMFGTGSGVGAFFGFCGIVAGIILAFFMGYTRSVVDNLILRLTVPGDEFVCAMNLKNLAAIQGMKAKIREKKR